MRNVEPGVDSLAAVQGADEQSCGHEKHQRQRELPDDQRAAEPCAPHTAAHRVVAQRGREIPAGHLNPWRQAEDDAGEQGNAQSKRQHADIWR